MHDKGLREAVEAKAREDKLDEQRAARGGGSGARSVPSKPPPLWEALVRRIVGRAKNGGPFEDEE